jgi:hypothetical protein
MFTDKVGGLAFRVCAALIIMLSASVGWAQRPQDNWYHEQTWLKTMAATNGGLSSPYGIAVGPDQRIYVGDQGLGRIQVYLPDGTFTFSITNGFGGGQSFSNPRGMITDKDGNLYVADYGRNAVFVFTKDGAFIRIIGGVAGSGDGQISGPWDVGVNSDGEVFVLEHTNYRVSVFSNEGVFRRKWGGNGKLDGLFSTYVTSLAVGPDSLVYVGQRYSQDLANIGQDTASCMIKVFDKNGIFKRKWETLTYGGYCVNLGAISIRVDSSGLICAALGAIGVWSNFSRSACDPILVSTSGEGATINSFLISAFPDGYMDNGYQFHAVSRDGTVFVVCKTERSIYVIRQAFRDFNIQPRNAIPMPAVTGIKQRSNSPLVDIDYEVTDADDTTVQTAMLVFTNSAATLKSCVRLTTLVEGTATNLGPNITANVPHRVTWDAGADWGIDLGSYRVAVLAKDSRQNLLDIHYLRLKDEQGQPKMTISRSPLIQNDFMQVWWWFLANNDSAISLTSGRVYGVESPYSGNILCSNEVTTAEGRAFIYGRMNVREATASELTWARAAVTTNSVEVWTPSRTVGGRPKAINEYGFDTGSWGASAWWVVAE